MAVIVCCTKRTPVFDEVAVRQAHRIQRRPAEHDVELRVAEYERVTLVDQRHVDVVAERFRQQSAELEASEACSKNDDARLHEK
ncbi:MAG: hypothetical protein WD036_05680 [Bauldia sp.]